MGESKQVKVDNWGIFFLQRLQTFFNKTYFCDLTLQFEDNVQLKVHRLVMNACTEYFQVLEQTCEVINDCLIMPPDLQADVVVPIVNFMYTGILEFQMSIFDRLYTTARLMNMTVLTKLLDAQKVPISPIPKPLNKRAIAPITWNLQGKKIAPKTMDPDLPEPLPGRKLPIWKRKSVPSSISYRNDLITGIPDPLSNKYFKSSADEPPKPTRFEWPDDDANFDTNSFDEISYTSKTIIIPQREKSPKPSTSSNNFEDLKRSSVSAKRPASPLYNDSKKVNIQDVKEYIKEQKLRSDYIDYDDSEAADNDLEKYENNNDSDDNKDDIFDQNADDGPNKSILKNDASTSHNKRVRFSLEGKENAAKVPQKTGTQKTVDMSNHTKIITEVLKKYPHLVKKNKNIKLKILAKGANVSSAGLKPVGTPVKVTKPAASTKVSYMVMKPGVEASKAGTPDMKKDGHWSCHKCSNPNPLHFDTYYLYRKHLTDVHNEKTDSQMCNICGHVSRKQNMLMYHKLIKHNITPPPSYHFPKCKDCSYVALSAGMLSKHQLIHADQNLACAECSTTFTTRSALISHIQLTGHTDKNNCPTYDCTYCTKKFISDETLFQHIKNNHKIEASKDNLLSSLDEEEEKKDNIITVAEIDALVENNEQEIIIPQVVEKPKEKIKILSDVKVTTALKNTKLQPVKILTGIPPQEETHQVDIDTQQLEPSSEAESLSNVASGIAASLGLVNTIVVLDDNQYILQSQDGSQENIISGNPQNIILPDNINHIQNLVGQQQVITTDANTIISQATLSKNNITSTDELVMVLTDHDYSDASNNAVITTENSNIVVLYSHPVQSQDSQFISQSGNLMINSDMSLVEVGSNYAVANTEPVDEKCEESIELIQQEIDNHLDGDPQEMQQSEKSEEEMIEFVEEKETKEQQAAERKDILIEPELEPMDVDPIEPTVITEEEHHQQQTTEEHLHQYPEQQISEENLQQQLTEEHLQIQLTEQQQMTEHLQQQMSEEHKEQQLSDEHLQQETEEHLPRETEEHPQQEAEEHFQQQIKQHVQQETEENLQEEQQILDENLQQETDEHPQQETDEHLRQEIGDDQQQITKEHLQQQITGEHSQQQITEEHLQQQTEEELQQQQQTEEELQQQQTEQQEMTEDHLQREISEEHRQQQQLIAEHPQQEVSEYISNAEESTEILDQSEKDEAMEQASEISEIIPEQIKNASAETAEDNYEEPMEIEESIEMIQQEIDRNCETFSEDVPQNSEENNIIEPETSVKSTSEEPLKKHLEAQTTESVEINEQVVQENQKTMNEDQQEEIEHMEVDSAKLYVNKVQNDATNSNEESTEKNSNEETKTEINHSGTKTRNSEAESLSEEISDLHLQLSPESNTETSVEDVLSLQEEETIPAKTELEELPERTETETETLDNNQDIHEINNIKTKENQEVYDSTVEEKETETPQEISTNKVSLESKTEEANEENKDANLKISNLLDDWDDGDTDSQQSDTAKRIATKPTADGRRVVNTLINDWEDDEET